MNKIGIITFTEGFNYGNKLQNFALKNYIETNFPQYEVKTVNNHVRQGNKGDKAKILIKWLAPSRRHFYYWKRLIRFKEFNKRYLNLTKHTLNNSSKDFEEVDMFVCGSDQIWNPNYYQSIDLLTGNMKKPKLSISYAASFGVSNIPNEKRKSFSEALNNLKAVSVREEQGVEICKTLGIHNARVNIDPTLLVDEEKWIKYIQRPNKNIPNNYVLNYFLGKISPDTERLIDQYCHFNNCKRVDLNCLQHLDWYDIDPFEFLYLIKNADIIFTDSFHASVFSIIFEKKFITFNRNGDSNNKMNSRIDTLLKTFNCEKHHYEYFDGNFESLTLEHDLVKNTIAYEQKRSYQYFKEFLK